ncbi:MAG: hypothetical protein ACOH2A_04420 [Sphingobacteriaceae bacterium]
MYDRKKRPDSLFEWRKQQLAIFQSYMMLLGYSLENLIKAISIKSYTSHKNIIIDFNDLRDNVWQVKNPHDLLTIAEKCDFILSDHEKNLIERHTEFLLWAGRYHIPKDKLKYDNAFDQQKLRRKKGDHLLIESIFSKGKKYLEN